MKPCNTCPFVKAHRLDGSPDWLRDVINFRRKDPFFSHTCHKTDPKADGYVGAKKARECAGHLMIMFNQMEGTPGRGGVYNSHDEMIERYLRKFLGDKEFEKIRDHAINKKLAGAHETQKIPGG